MDFNLQIDMSQSVLKLVIIEKHHYHIEIIELELGASLC